MKQCRFLVQHMAVVVLMMISTSVNAQTIAQKLAQAVQRFQSDPQMRHAIFSIYVADGKTGKKIYGHNEQFGLAPASTQKLFTSAAAYELLGKDFRYKTTLGYTGKVNDGSLQGFITITGSGDPTFGSWRWKETQDSVIIRKWKSAIRTAGITRDFGDGIVINVSKFTHQSIPDGWTWQDMGNYYGAGAYGLNWRENQYDLFLRSGSKLGERVELVRTKPNHVIDTKFENELTAAAKGTGDNAYLYFGFGPQHKALVKGTIPVDERSFSISGASNDPAGDFLIDLIFGPGGEFHGTTRDIQERNHISRNKKDLEGLTLIDTHLSPPLDSINYYFLRRSVNLYGEALVKTFALEKEGIGDTGKGIELLKNFWSAQGIGKSAIQIMDGSGLSPQNRVTTESEVKVLQYAKTRPWFASFYHALPEYNGMKMKSGSIGGARAYAGYHTAKDGKQYMFSIIVNNYDGSAGEVVRKMYRVLDVLK